MTNLQKIALAAVAALTVPAFAAGTARPGALNYVEGAVAIEGRPLTNQSVGSVTLNPGEILSTSQGRAEILLTPGVFLRLDDDSAVKMISPDLTHTQVELEHGRAAVEVDEIYDENNLDIIVDGVSTQLVKRGYYEFDAAPPMAMVFDGKAAVEVGDGKYKVVKAHHEIALAPGQNAHSPGLKAAGFNTDRAKGDFYNWNSLRSQYLAEANNQIAGQYAYAPGFAAGWYWDPYAWDYAFIGAGPFWSPFGWGDYPRLGRLSTAATAIADGTTATATSGAVSAAESTPASQAQASTAVAASTVAAAVGTANQQSTKTGQRNAASLGLFFVCSPVKLASASQNLS